MNKQQQTGQVVHHRRAVLLMRHAKSSWNNTSLSDHGRPLNKRGSRDAPRMAFWLTGQTCQPDWCLCSDSLRTRQTFQLMSEIPEFSCPVEYLPSLYHASPTEIIKQLQKLPEEIQAPLIIAHNPGLEELACIWTGEFRPFSTAAIMVVTFPQVNNWSEIDEQSSCDLINFQIPKQLEAHK